MGDIERNVGRVGIRADYINHTVERRDGSQWEKYVYSVPEIQVEYV